MNKVSPNKPDASLSSQAVGRTAPALADYRAPPVLAMKPNTSSESHPIPARDGVARASSSDSGELPPRQPEAPVDRRLSRQLEVLRQAHSALRAGQPRWVLTAIGRNSHLFSQSPLEEEAQAAQVLALCQLNGKPQAQLAVRRFLARWPGSPYAQRLLAECMAASVGVEPR
ncbi:hypothetical protein ACFL5O_09345 [Myxococcota bacterium]